MINLKVITENWDGVKTHSIFSLDVKKETILKLKWNIINGNDKSCYNYIKASKYISFISAEQEYGKLESFNEFNNNIPDDTCKVIKIEFLDEYMYALYIVNSYYDTKTFIKVTYSEYLKLVDIHKDDNEINYKLYKLEEIK